MNNNIFPCLWFDGNAKDAARFYCDVFRGEISNDGGMVINIKLFKQMFMLLNGGPHFQKNASISFMIICETESEVEQYWSKLSENGIVLMELGEYPWSKKYGWVLDQFGVTWQVNLYDEKVEQKIVPTLMYIHKNNGKAKEAIDLYTDVFPHSKINSILKYEDGLGDKTNEKKENIQMAHFELDGYHFFCMDNSYNHPFDFNEGISLVVMTDNQEETDYFWNRLTANGGLESKCGWLKDKFGVSWQIVPKKLLELMNGFNPTKSQKVMEAMLQMTKIEIDALEKAYQS